MWGVGGGGWADKPLVQICVVVVFFCLLTGLAECVAGTVLFFFLSFLWRNRHHHFVLLVCTVVHCLWCVCMLLDVIQNVVLCVCLVCLHV